MQNTFYLEGETTDDSVRRCIEAIIVIGGLVRVIVVVSKVEPVKKEFI